MQNTKQKKLAVIGPTATGKSSLGVHLATQFRGEVVSADSVQVYRGLDIGSGKITTEEMQDIPHHLLDVVNPGEAFSVAQYQKQAQEAIDGIQKRGLVPILVGGTGYYTQSTIENITFPNVPPNPTLRATLEKQSTNELADLLEKKDPARYEDIDIRNRKRIIRALEIIEHIGQVPHLKRTPPYDTLQIGLDMPDDELKKNIEERLRQRIAEGLIEEVQELRRSVSDEWLESVGLEYRYATQYLTGAFDTQEQFTETLNTKIWQYAKRQRTWFKKDSTITWYHPTQRKLIEKCVGDFL